MIIVGHDGGKSLIIIQAAVDFLLTAHKLLIFGAGFYLFDNINNGQYFLHIPSGSFGSGNPLNNTVSSTPEGIDDTQDDNADENGQNTLVAGGVSSTTIDLQPNIEPTGETGSGMYTGSLDDDHVNLTVDFGFFTCQAAACGTVTIQIND